MKNKLSGFNPPGCNPLRDEDRMPVLRVVSGDTWTVSASLCGVYGEPATPQGSHVEFVLAENQFSPPLWTGEWFKGVIPDVNRPGLVHVHIPRCLTKSLRRGSYMFSMRVSDRMRHSYSTQLVGNFLVEYMPTSDQHSIPYRDGTSEIFGGSCSVEDVSCLDPHAVRIKDERTGLYYKVVAVKANDGEVCLGVYQEGITEKEALRLGCGQTIRILDRSTGLYHRLVAYKAEDGEECIGVYQEGETADEIPEDEVGKTARVRNEQDGLLHAVYAVSDGGEVAAGVSQQGVAR